MFETSYWPIIGLLLHQFDSHGFSNHFPVLPLGTPSFGAHPWDLEATLFSNPYNFCTFNTIALNLFVSFLGQLLLNITQGLNDLEVSFSKHSSFPSPPFPAASFHHRETADHCSVSNGGSEGLAGGVSGGFSEIKGSAICAPRRLTWLEVAPSRDSTS